MVAGYFHGLKFSFANSARKALSPCPAFGVGVDFLGNFGVIHLSREGGFVIKNPLAFVGFFGASFISDPSEIGEVKG